MRTLKAALIGVGHVGRGFLKLLDSRRDFLRKKTGLDIRIVAVADSSGAALNSDGFDPTGLRQHKEDGKPVGALPKGMPGADVVELLGNIECDLVLEAAPVNLTTGEPGLSISRASLRRGMALVLADKGPLVIDYAGLMSLCQQFGGRMTFSATTAGPLPIINVGQRDLVGARVEKMRGVLNLTTNFMLEAMAQGHGFSQALKIAQEAGAAEADPTLDVEGWDAANKLVIAANAILEAGVTLDDVTVRGIAGITQEEIAANAEKGLALRLVATAEKLPGNGYRLSVAPEALPKGDFLAQISGWEVGIQFQTDIYGELSLKVSTHDPITTSAAMLRDVVTLFGQER